MQGGPSLQHNPDFSAAVVGKGVLQRISDQLIDDQAKRDGLLGWQMHVFGFGFDFDGNGPNVSEGVSQMHAISTRPFCLNGWKCSWALAIACTRVTAFSSALHASELSFVRACSERTDATRARLFFVRWPSSRSNIVCSATAARSQAVRSPSLTIATPSATTMNPTSDTATSPGNRRLSEGFMSR